MRLSVIFLAFIFIFSHCTTKITSGVYQGEVEEWYKNAGEFPVEYYEFKRGNKFRYWTIFCILQENGFGKYEIKNDSIYLNYSFQPISRYQIFQLPNSSLDTSIELEVIKMPKTKEKLCRELTLIVEDGRQHFDLKLGESVKFTSNSEISSLSIHSLCFQNLFIELPENLIRKNIRIEVAIENTLEYAISDTSMVKNFKVLNDSTILIGNKVFKKSGHTWHWN